MLLDIIFVMIVDSLPYGSNQTDRKRHHTETPCGQTDTCNYIILSQTSFAEVKKVLNWLFTYHTSACPRGFHNWHERRCYEYNGDTFPAMRSQWYYGRDKKCPDWSGTSHYLVEFNTVAEMENVTKGLLGMYEIRIIPCLILEYLFQVHSVNESTV